MKNHLKYLDSLRLIACFLVVGIHISGMDFETNLIARIFDCACGYAVPIFVTISDACFIGIITDYKKIIKQIVLLVIAYLLWWVFYLVISLIFTSVLKSPTLRTTYAFIDIMINVLLVFISSLIIYFVGYRIPIINKFMFLRKI